MTYKKMYMTFNIKRHMHARVIFRCQQIHGSSGADATTSMENIGEQVYV